MELDDIASEGVPVRMSVYDDRKQLSDWFKYIVIVAVWIQNVDWTISLCFRLAMNHFGLENEVNSVIRMDAPFARGPQMRWQRKMADSFNLSKSDSTLNCSLSQSSSGSSKTPMKPVNNSVLSENGGRNSNGSSKTPGKTPHRTSKTPSELEYFLFITVSCILKFLSC